MGLNELFALSIKVLSDWRVIGITIAIILLWAALRYVGMVYHKRASPQRRSAPRSLSKVPSARGKAAPKEAASGSPGEDTIE